MYFVEFCSCSDISVSSDTGSHHTLALESSFPAYPRLKNRPGPGWANCNPGKRGKGKTQRQRNLMSALGAWKKGKWAESIGPPQKKKKESHPESKIDIQAKEIWREWPTQLQKEQRRPRKKGRKVEEFIFFNGARFKTSAHEGARACVFAATELTKFGSKYIFKISFPQFSLSHNFKTSHFIKAKETFMQRWLQLGPSRLVCVKTHKVAAAFLWF